MDQELAESEVVGFVGPAEKGLGIQERSAVVKIVSIDGKTPLCVVVVAAILLANLRLCYSSITLKEALC